MDFGNHPYLIFYVVGCVITVLLAIAQVIVFTLLNFLTRANIADRNLKKLAPPNRRTWTEKVVLFSLRHVVGIFGSWLSVVAYLWQFVAVFFRTLRESLTPVPEEIKLLRFPLRHNPDMTREAVWAYVVALAVKGGGATVDINYVSAYLTEARRDLPSFTDGRAIDILKGLKVLDPVMLDSALALSRDSS